MSIKQKQTSQWRIIKKEPKKGIIKYSFTNGKNLLEVDGATEFVNISPIENGVGAVAVEKRTTRSIKINWYIVNEEGAIVYQVNDSTPKRIDDVNQNTFLIPARDGSEFIIVGETGTIETFTLPSQLGKYLKGLTFPEEASPEL